MVAPDGFWLFGLVVLLYTRDTSFTVGWTTSIIPEKARKKIEWY
jgi:hypothetical protein